MKKLLFLVAIIATAFVSSCDKFDDSEIWNKLENHENRISALEELCKQLNTNINALRTIVNALEKNDYITNVSPIRKDGEIIGYTITFAHSDTITIYNGADGKDGADGYTPQIGVMKDTDGIYYWTVDGEWLLDAKGNKIKAVGQDGKDGQDGVDGEDGKDGQNGTNGTDGEDGKDGQDGADGKDGQDGADGVTPRLMIENGYWYISYDDGKSWEQLGKATGEDGADGVDGSDGADGDSIFASVTQDDEYVYFYLTDGSVIKLPKSSESNIIIFADKDVKKVCIGLWDTDGDAELSKQEAAEVTSIGTVFSQNTEIEYFNEFKYFENVSSIDENAFGGCENLKTIFIPMSVASIDVAAFEGCESLYLVKFDERSRLTVIEGYFSSDSKDYNGVFCDCKSLKSINIPASIVEIQACAFQGCTNLSEVTFEDNSSLRIIGGGWRFRKEYSAAGTYYPKLEGFGAFNGCIALNEITIPASVETIEACAFRGCTGLSNLYFEQHSNLKRLGGGYAWKPAGTSISSEIRATFGCFENCTSLLSVCIPASVEIIEACAFQNCSNLKDLTFENGANLREFSDGHSSGTYHTFVTGAFAKCSNLELVKIPASVEKIGIGTFNMCTSLKVVEFAYNSSLVTIGGSKGSIDNYQPSSQGTKEYGAFSGCSSLSNIILPSTLSNIGEVAFSRCSNLMDIYVKSTTSPVIKSNTFSNTPAGMRIYVPMESVDEYKAATYWQKYSNVIIGYDFSE